MAEPHDVLNALGEDDARAALVRCCGARAWVAAMLAQRPFASTAALLAAADEAWARLPRTDVLEAFAHHPRIGASLDELRARFASTSAWASDEQAGARGADATVLERLFTGNLAYEAKFGFIFIVCASGKSAAEMLALLEARLGNPIEAELPIAAGEQAKITRLRLGKLGT